MLCYTEHLVTQSFYRMYFNLCLLMDLATLKESSTLTALSGQREGSVASVYSVLGLDVPSAQADCRQCHEPLVTPPVATVWSEAGGGALLPGLLVAAWCHYSLQG